MLARQLLIGFLAVIVPSAVLLGTVTFYSLHSLERVHQEVHDILHSRQAIADLRLTLTQTGSPLGAFLFTGDT